MTVSVALQCLKEVLVYEIYWVFELYSFEAVDSFSIAQRLI